MYIDKHLDVLLHLYIPDEDYTPMTDAELENGFTEMIKDQCYSSGESVIVVKVAE